MQYANPNERARLSFDRGNEKNALFADRTLEILKPCIELVVEGIRRES